MLVWMFGNGDAGIFSRIQTIVRATSQEKEERIMPSSPERYVALQQQSTGAVQVIAGTVWTTDAQQFKDHICGGNCA